MLPDITYLDIETTGATPLRDRVTEIALIRFQNGKEVMRWQTLINPETAIPAYIQQLTGITDEMVQTAPTFADIADEVLMHLNGTVMAAHNVRFDHGFLKSEFKRLGITLRQRVLCTVKLSRRLYPDHQRHSLDAIMQRHQLTTESRHRAMSDVELMIGFVQAAQAELGPARVSEIAALLSKTPSLPSQIDEAVIDVIPDSAGVYLFYGENELPLYIGKSVHLRQRVLSHFSADHASAKEMRISQEVKRIEWIETAGELGALLLESKLIKQRQPIHNRRLRRERQLCSWLITTNPEQLPQVTLVNKSDIEPSMFGQIFGTYRSKHNAIEALRQLADTHQLCPKLLGLESGKGHCFAFQLKKCRGACAGHESLITHHLRLSQALSQHKLKAWPYAGKIAIRETCKTTGKTDIHVFDQWCHIATVDNDADLYETIQNRSVFAFDLDSYKMLLKALASGRYEKIVLPSADVQQ